MKDVDVLKIIRPKKINLVILSDGYREDDESMFCEKIEKFKEYIEKECWYNFKIDIKKIDEAADSFSLDGRAECSEKIKIGNLINIVPKFIKSEDAGVGVSRKCGGINPIYVDNKFGSRFCHGRTLQDDHRTPLRIMQGDMHKVKKELYAIVDWDYVLVLSNNINLKRTKHEGCSIELDRRYLRGAFSDVNNKIAWVTANSNDWFALAMHELGHLMFNLHEEYDYYSDETSNSEYLYEEGIPESNIMPTLRVKALLEKLRGYIVLKYDFEYHETEDGKDLMIKTCEIENFKGKINKLIKPDDEDGGIGLTKREKDWFLKIEEKKPGNLFRYKTIKKGPFKDDYSRISSNIFWKKIYLDNEDYPNEEYLYYDRKLLEDAKANNYLGFYEGAGTYYSGLVRPLWSCRMRETRSKERIDAEKKYVKCLKSVQNKMKCELVSNCCTITTNDCNLDNGADFTCSPPNKDFCDVCEQSIRRKIINYLLNDSLYEAALTFINSPQAKMDKNWKPRTREW